MDPHTPYYRKVWAERIEKYGVHPNCTNCLKANICMVAAYPNYSFECNEKVEATAPAKEKKRERKS